MACMASGRTMAGFFIRGFMGVSFRGLGSVAWHPRTEISSIQTGPFLIVRLLSPGCRRRGPIRDRPKSANCNNLPAPPLEGYEATPDRFRLPGTRRLGAGQRLAAGEVPRAEASAHPRKLRAGL